MPALPHHRRRHPLQYVVSCPRMHERDRLADRRVEHEVSASTAPAARAHAAPPRVRQSGRYAAAPGAVTCCASFPAGRSTSPRGPDAARRLDVKQPHGTQDGTIITPKARRLRRSLALALARLASAAHALALTFAPCEAAATSATARASITFSWRRELCLAPPAPRRP